MISPTVWEFWRNVAVSITFPPSNLTCASLNRRPIRKQLRNAFFTSFGLADVPTSKSFGLRPMRRSRTPPPTRYAVKPSDESLYRTFKASGSMFLREIQCSGRAYTTGTSAFFLFFRKENIVLYYTIFPT